MQRLWPLLQAARREQASGHEEGRYTDQVRHYLVMQLASEMISCAGNQAKTTIYADQMRGGEEKTKSSRLF